MSDELGSGERSAADNGGLSRVWTTLRWIAVAVMVPLGGIPRADRFGTAEAVLSVALIAGFAFFDSLTQVDVTSTGVSFKIRNLERRQKVLQSELDAVRDRVTALFLNTMAPSMYGQLAKLRAGGFRDYAKTRDFEREMTNLRDAGYVGDFDWAAIPDGSADLSAHIRITPLGEEFLDLRERLVREAGVAPEKG
jgi:hypothetical protein